VSGAVSASFPRVVETRLVHEVVDVPLVGNASDSKGIYKVEVGNISIIVILMPCSEEFTRKRPLR